jgi:hypothetical protein
MTGINCDLFTHKSSRSYLNHLVHIELLHVSASTGHLQGAVHILQKHQTVTLQRRLCLSRPDNR